MPQRRLIGGAEGGPSWTTCCGGVTGVASCDIRCAEGLQTVPPSSASRQASGDVKGSPDPSAAGAGSVVTAVPAHKFAVGQKVRFIPDTPGQVANRGEIFVVARQLPETGGVFQYQIKSEEDGHARVVRESQLTDL